MHPPIRKAIAGRAGTTGLTCIMTVAAGSASKRSGIARCAMTPDERAQANQEWHDAIEEANERAAQRRELYAQTGNPKYASITTQERRVEYR